jgi:hypothetical protein
MATVPGDVFADVSRQRQSACVVETSGAEGSLEARSGSGDVRAETIDGRVNIRTGSGGWS